MDTQQDGAVAVVGTGLIGQGWAIVFARAGLTVRLWDGDAQALSRAVGLIAAQLQALAAHGLVQDVPAIVARLQPCAALEDALAGVDYVQESLPERVEVKREIHARLDAVAPSAAILASSTSSIPASAFTEDLPGRGRCVIAHPVNPPYLVPVVEICGAPWTEPEVVRRAAALMERVKQAPVIVRRELEGFVLNRLQGALLREAFRLYEQGYVDAEGLDRTIRDGLGLRWSFMGPFETIDLNAPEGLADYCARYGGMYESIAREQADSEPWPPALVARLHAERRAALPAAALADRRIWRDERLMRLAALKQGFAADDGKTS